MRSAVCRYSYRWLIERFHFVLKSGCRFEDLQLENAERLKRALGIVAWRLLLRSASPTRATMQRGAPGRRFTASIIAHLILRRTRPPCVRPSIGLHV